MTMMKAAVASNKEDTDSSNHHEDEEYLPNHTISMRAALEHCRKLLECRSIDASTVLPPNSVDTALDAYNAAKSISCQRQKALEEISNNFAIQVIDYSEKTSVLDFRKRFLHANRPCLIRGLDVSQHFAQVSSTWCTRDSQVNRSWFLNTMGEGAVVPVRQQSTSTDLDDDGRANECSTLEMTLREWCQTTDSPQLYLKDWHFQKWWEQHHGRPLPYSVPPLFRNDLLNALLLNFTDGDYRFVYWGHTGSESPLHSDVLHSYSWSFNVVGEKRWTFYIPDSSGREIVFDQHAGEMVFVPAMWKHKVENLRETLSINHNWITTASIDYTWECLLTEMNQVESELSKWDEDPSWDAREFMLRGCVGLDVTAFFFMVVTEQARLLTRDMSDETTGEEESWERFFDMFRLEQVLESLLQPQVHLHERLAAMLEHDKLVMEAMDITKMVATIMDKVKATIFSYKT